MPLSQAAENKVSDNEGMGKPDPASTRTKFIVEIDRELLKRGPAFDLLASKVERLIVDLVQQYPQYAFVVSNYNYFGEPSYFSEINNPSMVPPFKLIEDILYTDIYASKAEAFNAYKALESAWDGSNYFTHNSHEFDNNCLPARMADLKRRYEQDHKSYDYYLEKLKSSEYSNIPRSAYVPGGHPYENLELCVRHIEYDHKLMNALDQSGRGREAQRSLWEL